ncbi:MAG: guanylate kinase [Candidatus Magasanikbacteria bacterium CG_4_9_14_0_2_um_filter_41_10]|uniref:Guanylate kinase n=1 Tax=Candidatus Magasanikbacteria bacterium CG_4_10_14_0_2_um_filter_41_31 TaxID=1974639 RepID=A0A2M7V1P8_9BACT|nr:MAG: guanylate kinase [Candidatus Magasanikbacteria bacterium CG1_02_41_34]PIZ92259.1 MAG: guanylate kinase [Candidatus Magasanikbacteria bacterium CG_4_10_14_0_2_um_filter_41_31]PJC53192.1 MAG: guanylate kinase [Candidatus Magasanikbacteria bacterium CG_4_9_14_0_2_um_filter_41_10]
MKHTGHLILISSPSGGGKNSVIKEMIARFDNATQFVTTTTREKRDGEIDGTDYHFLSQKTFEEKLDAGDFVEYNDYAGNLYGTEKEKLETSLEKFDLVFSQADVNGKHSLDKLNIPHLSIFLMPESMDILRERIINRGGVSEEKMHERLHIAEEELETSKDYDYRVVNKEGELEKTVEKIRKIIEEYQKKSK